MGLVRGARLVNAWMASLLLTALASIHVIHTVLGIPAEGLEQVVLQVAQTYATTEGV